MRSLWRSLGALAVVLLFATAAAAALPYFGLDLLAPHTARRSAATLDDGLRRAVDAGLDRASITSLTEARDFSLSVTDKLLRFGLDHPTSLAFSAVEREADCVEYAHLFARVFERAAARANLQAKAYVVHSAEARVFGRKVPMERWQDHDWVLIEDRSGGEKADPRRHFIDPTLHDAGLGWDVSANVKGAIDLPR